MTRVAYFGYVAVRVLTAAAVAGGAALLAHFLLRAGRPWAGPLAAGFLAHVLLGPKQRRPVFPRRPGALYVYAGIAVDRHAGCRGGCVTGATGSGKTLACILPRLHSLCVNQPGAVEPARRGEAGLGRYRIPPWGGLICGEKGNEWVMAERLLRRHGRGADLQVLRTRPAGAAADWRPEVRLNLAGIAGVPADTYAKLLVDTSLAVEEAAHRDEFFVPQARDKIAWGLRLTWAAAAHGAAPPPTLLGVLDLLTVPESYRQFVARALAQEPALGGDPAFGAARYQLEHNYWTQPPEQLGGVRSTVYNVLAPFAEPEIAAVFCADSTLDLRDLERGLVVALAVPQRYAVQRRYVTTLLKAFVYHLIAERFDRGPAAAPPNVILVEQDEWQRHAVRADCDVDIVREAGGAVYAATQSQNAVWLKLGGREAAAPLIANLRNRWICQAATAECAEESSRFLSGRRQPEASHSRGDAGRSTTVSWAERPHVPPAALRALAPFHVIFAPAEGPWLYRRGIAMPVTAEGGIPAWWFGDWNPLTWLAAAAGRPGRPLLPPWRAAAPLRAQLRWLLGLDGTFIVTGGRRARAMTGE